MLVPTSPRNPLGTATVNVQTDTPCKPNRGSLPLSWFDLVPGHYAVSSRIRCPFPFLSASIRTVKSPTVGRPCLDHAKTLSSELTLACKQSCTTCSPESVERFVYYVCPCLLASTLQNLPLLSNPFFNTLSPVHGAFLFQVATRLRVVSRHAHLACTWVPVAACTDSHTHYSSEPRRCRPGVAHGPCDSCLYDQEL